MDALARLGEKLFDTVLQSGGFAALIIFLVGMLFAFLYFKEKNRNRELTDTILQNSEKHATRFADVVTENIESDSKLAVAIGQLTATISDIKHKLELLVDTGGSSRRR